MATVTSSERRRRASADGWWRLRPEYASWDAEARFDMPGVQVTGLKAAQCGEVLKGVLKPHQCKLFGRECTPERPVGALVVSSEGACAAYHNYVYHRHRRRRLEAVHSAVSHRQGPQSALTLQL
jgi:hydrogenase expression/formation protein HypD